MIREEIEIQNKIVKSYTDWYEIEIAELQSKNVPTNDAIKMVTFTILGNVVREMLRNGCPKKLILEAIEHDITCGTTS